MSKSKTTHLGRFEVVKRLGGGSQGTVFLAKDPHLGRDVAIKLLHGEWGERMGSKRDFPAEARVSGRLRHPNIVSIFEAGDYRRVPYLVFEYVEGRTLRESLPEHQALSAAKACALMRGILDGIAHAHENGVVHLDLSPGNILVDGAGVPRIMDFGLARMAGAPLSVGECPVGTLRYMSPEHFRGPSLGPHTDVFALSLILYELIAGQPAFPAKTPQRILEQILHGEIDMSPFAGTSRKQRLAHFLEGGLEKDPRARFADGVAMRRAFEAAVGEFEDARSRGAGRAERHSTLDFLLRRMQRKKDFPVLSQALADINRLASSSSNASANKLAQVILKDYALTNKLLKVANSAFYGSIGGEVTSVSHAVRILGFEQVRMAANSLAYFSHLRSETASTALQDSLTKSFVSALLARHLAQRLKLPGVEEAFICGMFCNLGETLTIYYFPEEHRDIVELMDKRRVGKSAASASILGISYAALATGVARAWQFPDEIVHVIGGTGEQEVTRPQTPADRLRHLSVFSNELCDIAGGSRQPDKETKDRAAAALIERFEPSFHVPPELVPRMLDSAIEKLGQYSQALGMSVPESPFCQSVLGWIHEDAGAPEGADADITERHDAAPVAAPAAANAAG